MDINLIKNNYQRRKDAFYGTWNMVRLISFIALTRIIYAEFSVIIFEFFLFPFLQAYHNPDKGMLSKEIPGEIVKLLSSTEDVFFAG